MYRLPHYVKIINVENNHLMEQDNCYITKTVPGGFGNGCMSLQPAASPVGNCIDEQLPLVNYARVYISLQTAASPVGNCI